MIMIMMIIARNALQCNYSYSLQTTLLNLIPCRCTALEIIGIFFVVMFTCLVTTIVQLVDSLKLDLKST